MKIFNKRGQVTIFVILAILIVGGIVAYFLLRDNLPGSSVNPEVRPAYDFYVSCLEENAREGVNFLGTGGGHIKGPEFEPGSSFSPFSNYLDFLGQGVPYWLYLSGNNILSENVPTKSSMESELEDYLRDRANNCDFSDVVSQGYDVFLGDVDSVDVKIEDNNIKFDIKSSITIFKGDVSSKVNSHSFILDSKLGKFHKLAVDVYNYEKESAFLEKYSLDVMRLYAPVDGVEEGCSPLIFNEEEIKQNLSNGLFSNIGSLKISGNYYDLLDEKRNYFVEDSNLNIDENLNFMYLPNWPTKIEIYGDTVINPVGTQKGLAALGFCYVPYHFVYDIKFPVIVQFFDEDEVFQFPLVVIIDKSQERNAIATSTGVSIDSRVCDYPNQDVLISTYDVNLNPVPATVSFECLDSTCPIGETKLSGDSAKLDAKTPQCINGYLVARANGYAEARYQISTNEADMANIVLDKKYTLGLDLGLVKKAIVTFSGDKHSTTIVYPDTKEVELIEDLYNISVYAYENSTINFPAIKDSKCVQVPESGIAGILGGEEEKCFDINIPASSTNFAVVGGGKTTEYFLAEELENSNEININVPLFELPKSLEDLQKNSIAAEDEQIYVSFE